MTTPKTMWPLQNQHNISQYMGEIEKQFQRVNSHFQGRADQRH